jgi:hypothetical protein
LKKGFLVDGLIGAATLQPRGAISRQQQQGDPALIGLHECRQQVGDR